MRHLYYTSPNHITLGSTSSAHASPHAPLRLLTTCCRCRPLITNSTNVKALFLAMATAMYTWSGTVVPANVYTVTRLLNVALVTDTLQSMVDKGSCLCRLLVDLVSC